MKRWIIWAMLAAVLLTGCTGDGAAGTSSDQTVQTTAPDPGLYIPDSDIQLQTDGAVRQYALGHEGFCTMDFMGADVLLFFGQEGGVLVNRLTGDNCSVAASGTLPVGTYPNDTTVRVEGRMLAYYNAADNSVVYFNDFIRETGRRQLPHSISDQPVLGRDLYSAYYCVGAEMFAADLRAGFARLVRQYSTESPEVQQILFDDSLILCTVADTGEGREYAFISSQTGASLGTDSTLGKVVSCNDNYLLSRQDGTVEEILFGVKGNAPKLLLPKEEGKLYPVITMNGAVVETQLENGSKQLSFYDLATGRRTSEVTIQSLAQVVTLASDDSGSYVWIVASDGEENETLLRWDVSVSAIDDTTDYSRQRYTLENPDKEGLAQCQTLADDISKRYGIDVLLVDEIKQPDGYTIQYEYQVKAIRQGLEGLDAVLSKFPEGFFAAMSSIGSKEGIHIGLVRSVTGQSQHGAAEPEGLQYWLDGEAYVALTLGGDFEKAVLHEISHVLDTYIFTNSILYDEWYEVNPTGFRYDENYSDYLDHTESSYLSGKKRCFIDAYSMSFAKEDRARILEYAMTDGNEECFESTAMQNKLLRVCRAIRDAYDWKKDTRTFPWEQYLNESIAYVKKE